MDAARTAPLQRLIDFYSTLTRESAADAAAVYAAGASFKDPFNDVRGSAAISRILLHTFDDLSDARFVIREAVEQDGQAFLLWDFTFRVKRWQPGIERAIHGASHVRFDAAGKVSYHRDYWDAGEELYEKLPLFGALVRWVRRRFG